MTKEELIRFTDFLDYFNVDWKSDVIKIGSGDFSVIMNPNTQWKDFLGYSIANVAEVVAKELNKKCIYISDME